MCFIKRILKPRRAAEQGFVVTPEPESSQQASYGDANKNEGDVHAGLKHWKTSENMKVAPPYVL